MARLSVGVPVASLLLIIGIAACAASDDYPILQPPNGGDAAVDARIGGDGSTIDSTIDAVLDAVLDAPPPGADLSIAIIDSPDAVAASSTLTYTIEVTNHGGLDTETVTVTQRLPPGNIAFQTASGIGWTCAAVGQVVTCTRVTLLVGAAPSIVVTVTTPPIGGSITTTATVESEMSDPDMSNNDASAGTVVLTPADLALAIADSPDPVAAGGTLSYAITVTNLGPGTSTGIAVLDSLPTGVAFVSASGTGWSCSAVDQDVTCLSPMLAVAAGSAITLVVTAPNSGGTVSNTASVIAMTPDANPANNQATTPTTVNAAADLSIAMIDSPDPVFGSGLLHYLIDVKNLGPNTASGIVVNNGLPAGNVAFVSAIGGGWTCQQSGQVISCARPSLLVGAAPTITITVQAPSESASLVDVATVTSTSSDLDPANNSVTVNTSVLAAADLSVGVIDAADPVITNGTLTYVVTASNAGPSQAAAVSVTSALPANTVFQSATGINWTCSAIGQQVTCSTPLMVIGAAPAITIVVTAPGLDGPITETSSISSATADLASANNTASQTTVVNAPSDLALALSASPSPVPASSTLTYTLVITNFGPRDATDLVVTNRLPDGDVVFVGAGGTGWTCALAGQIVTCTRLLLIAGTAPSIAIQIRTPAANAVLVDEATVSASTTDLNLANNIATDTTDVIDSADLSILASDSPDPVHIGSELRYTLSVANDGPTSATAVSVVDTLPTGTEFASASGSGWSCTNAGQVVTCTTTSLDASSSAPSISIFATAPGTVGNITNTATVSSSTSDPDSANNSVTSVTFANVFADLSVVVKGIPDPVQGTPLTGCGNNDCVTYSIDVTSAGPDPATGLTVITTLPPNGLFFNGVGSGWVCPAPSATTLTCTRTGLASGAVPTIFLTWKAPSPGGFSIVFTMTVSGTSTDPDPANNTVTHDTTVRP